MRAGKPNKPFFAKFLEGQKRPSTALPTPGPSQDPVTTRYPSDHEDGGDKMDPPHGGAGSAS
jgi:hypothetical protein